tara:strand:- start:204 stop:1379 length:1176 start_codon:yes stop_codon:yes gene_type:complete
MSEIKVNSIKGVGASTAAITIDNSSGGCTANITNNLSNRNLIINGAMNVAQRGSSSDFSSSSTLSAFTLDRFRYDLFPFGGTSATATVSKSTTAPDGFLHSLKVDVTATDTSLVANNYSQITYQLEKQDIRHFAYGTSAAKTITLSFYVRSNKTGNYNVNLLQYGASTRLASFTYAISSADTWERKTITIAGDTSGNVVDGNSSGLGINFGLAYGGNYITGSNQNSFGSYVAANSGVGQNVNLYDSTSNEWYITGVQLEVGSVATDFEHRSFAQELALCQRYFQTIGVGFIAACRGASSSQLLYSYTPPVNLRASPTISTTNDGFNGTFGVRSYRDGSGTSDSTTTPATNSAYFTDMNPTIHLTQQGFSVTDDRSATIFVNGGAITLSAEL